MVDTAQAQEKSYDLHSLGWKSFQDLCLTIISEVLGQTVQMFSPSKDAGRDGAFHGTWNAEKGTGTSGSFTVQCKFTTKRDIFISMRSLSDELTKARRLAFQGLADNYILMTNYGVSGSAEAQIRKSFLEIPKMRDFSLLGSEWITQKIRESSRLRMLVPRVYGLGDLSQILDERAYTQAQEILSSMRENISKIVITDAYRKSATALINHGFVLLLGEPAAGKSTIAACLALGALDSWGCSTMMIRDADDFQRHWNPHEPRQFFWVDDAFGTTQYQRTSAYQWNRVFPHMQAAIKRGTCILFTSRDYIYRAALSDLKIHAFPLLRESQIVINVHELSISEKEQILYNHIKLGDQDLSFRTRIKPYLPSVAASQRFLPEVARRLGSRVFTKRLSIDTNSMMEFVERPLSFLVDVMRSLDTDSRSALALIFMHGGSLVSPISLEVDDEKALELLGTSLAAVRESLKNMGGTLTQLVYVGGIPKWVFKHPTIGDALATIVAEDPELLDIYLAGTSTERLLHEVTCGDLQYEGVRVVISSNRYNAFMKRLDCVVNYDSVLYFLASRCERTFIKTYIDFHKDLFGKVCNPRPYIGATPNAAVVARLHELGLLPEQWRVSFVAGVEELAIEIPDADFLNIVKIRQVFRESEITKIINRFFDEVLAKFSLMIDDWESNYNPSRESPEQYYEPLKDALESFAEELVTRDIRSDSVGVALSKVEESIQHLNERYYEPDYDEDREIEDRGHEPDELSMERARSIFDDIDE